MLLHILTTFVLLLSSPNASEADLTINFSNIKKDKGQLMVALRDTKGEMVKGVKVPVTKTGTISYTITGIKLGNYTLAVYHDINSDEELNTNMVGLPTEPYGFSNNARGTFGPPSLKDQTFSISGNTTISITLK